MSGLMTDLTYIWGVSEEGVLEKSERRVVRQNINEHFVLLNPQLSYSYNTYSLVTETMGFLSIV